MPAKRSPQQKRVFPNEAGKGYVKAVASRVPSSAAADGVEIDVAQLPRVHAHELHDAANVKGRSVVFQCVAPRTPQPVSCTLLLAWRT